MSFGMFNKMNEMFQKKQLSLKENKFIYKELKSLCINFAIKLITRHAILFVCL